MPTFPHRAVEHGWNLLIQATSEAKKQVPWIRDMHAASIATPMSARLTGTALGHHLGRGAPSFRPGPPLLQRLAYFSAMLGSLGAVAILRVIASEEERPRGRAMADSNWPA